jgi:hypothetical protein
MGLFDFFGGDSSTSTTNVTTKTNSDNTSFSRVVNLSNVGNPQVVVGDNSQLQTLGLGVELVLGASLILGGLYLVTKKA